MKKLLLSVFCCLLVVSTMGIDLNRFDLDSNLTFMKIEDKKPKYPWQFWIEIGGRSRNCKGLGICSIGGTNDPNALVIPLSLDNYIIYINDLGDKQYSDLFDCTGTNDLVIGEFGSLVSDNYSLQRTEFELDGNNYNYSVIVRIK